MLRAVLACLLLVQLSSVAYADKRVALVIGNSTYRYAGELANPRNDATDMAAARAMGTRTMEIGRGLAPVESGVGTLISFATQPGNVALDGSGRNSPFAGALVRHIAGSSDSLSDLLIAVRNDVRKETDNKQVPWERSALTGRFYFNPTTQQREPPAEEIARPQIPKPPKTQPGAHDRSAGFRR